MVGWHHWLSGHKFEQIPGDSGGQRICVCVLRHVQLFATPWTVARQAPLPMELSRQEDWSGLPFPTSGDLPDSGIKPASPVSPDLAGRFFTTESWGKPSLEMRILFFFGGGAWFLKQLYADF